MHITDGMFDDIVYDYSQTLFKIAYSYTKSIPDSEDIVQEVFLKLYKINKSFENKDHIKNWLIRVTINQSLDMLKHKQKEILINEKYINNISDNSNVKSNNEEIRECVLALKDNYKTIIILYYYDDYSIKEISDILKISEDNVKVRLNRARNKLKEIINERKDKYEKR